MKQQETAEEKEEEDVSPAKVSSGSSSGSIGSEGTDRNMVVAGKNFDNLEPKIAPVSEES